MKNIHICIIGGNGRLGKEISLLCTSPVIIDSKTKIENIDFKAIDIFIDVSSADVIAHYIESIRKAKKPLVVGSTGHSKKTIMQLESVKNEIPLLIAPNFSKGIFLLKKLIKQIKTLPASITETHHIHKKDKPSGTAKEISTLLEKEVPITSIRKQEAFGTHTITYQFGGEELEITHRAQSRELFAKGAMAALSFLYQKEKGYYTMDDVYSEEKNERDTN
ncbi:MAG: 4-hydroxy-tetrahydrodipicolinate reductase [Chlamydiia bacterium]|nr:4-hydroxy-tetrahydrodipicolinate reductase [Chlamydiia bacterium]MCH9618761.1 4-hydroxy-tetrahydrodipicolinate reductase [Chlamydiia bacterium]MCH9624438.1 4-hydroxy-tetrahydrodipicolinate reductase [Chlamydiia bacterium]